MRTVNIRKLRKDMKQELEDLPLVISRNGIPVANISVHKYEEREYKETSQEIPD